MKKLKLDFQQLNAEVLSRNQMKTILGGILSGGDGECSTSVTCSDGGKISCSSNGAAGNTQGGDSCQKTPTSVTCYDIGAPNNWSYSHC